MKTRRILAASTAALLAFGTTAVISTTASAKDVTIIFPQPAYGDAELRINGTRIPDLLNVDDGAEITVVATPAGGYELEAITVTKTADDTPVAVNNGVFTMPGEGVTVLVTFAKAGEGDKTSDTTSNTTSGTTSTTTPAATEPKTLNKIEEDKAVSIGGGVKITLSEKDVEKFEEEKYEKYNITAEAEDVVGNADGDKTYVETGDDANSAVKGLDKALKKEIAKIETKNFKIINIDLADGDYVESTSPVAIKLTVNLDKDYNVYHVSGKTVEKLSKSSRKMTDGTYEISFSTKKFSPFIFTTADLKNAGGTTSDGEPTSAAATSGGSTTNPNTGIALAIAPVVLAAGAVAVVALKKKK